MEKIFGDKISVTFSGCAECVLCQSVQHVDTVDDIAVVDWDVKSYQFDGVWCRQPQRLVEKVNEFVQPVKWYVLGRLQVEL